MRWYFEVLKKYADFHGRARRKEYWFFTLVNLAIMVVLSILLAIAAYAGGNNSGPAIVVSVLFVLYWLAIIVPAIAVSIRRLHDTNKSGWWLLAAVIPFVNMIGGIVLLVFYCLDSDPGTNAYGPNPKGIEAVAASPASA